KGCCCKRSQCIKNYCDCYQSMTTCSIYCKCIGCRNTEERVTTATPPKKSAQATKRERAVTQSAKAAAAAAAKEGTNILLKPAPVTALYTTHPQPQKIIVPQLAPVAAIQLPDVDLENVITLPPPNASVQAKKPQAVQPTIAPLPAPPRDVNVLNPTLNAALLECVVVQALEAEEFGFNEQHVSKLVFHEFSRNLQAILK
ncbi:hypothetical protein KR093_010691, partial [Drosophila rubida]